MLKSALRSPLGARLKATAATLGRYSAIQLVTQVVNAITGITIMVKLARFDI